MGRKSKSKANRRSSQHVVLAGEQAEVFDTQMDTDRAWFEANDHVAYIRPQIPGEWNEQKMLGHEPITIGLDAPDGTPAFLPQQATWTAVVDLGRLRALVEDNNPDTPPSGCRTRFACPPPLSPEADRNLRISAARTALACLNAVRRHSDASLSTGAVTYTAPKQPRN